MLFSVLILICFLLNENILSPQIIYGQQRQIQSSTFSQTLHIPKSSGWEITFEPLEYLPDTDITVCLGVLAMAHEVYAYNTIPVEHLFLYAQGFVLCCILLASSRGGRIGGR